jgi:CRP/FNR family transcriptional regulator
MYETALFQSQYPKASCLSRSASKLCLSIDLNSQDLERLNTLIIERIRVRKGSALYRMGDPLRSLYAVRVGTFKTSMMSVDGHNQIMGFQIPGDMLDLEAISTGYYGCDALALEDSEVIFCDWRNSRRICQLYNIT